MRFRRQSASAAPADGSGGSGKPPGHPPLMRAQCVVKGLMLSTAQGFPDVVLEQMTPQDERHAAIAAVEADTVHADYRRTVTAVPLFELEVQMRATLCFEAGGVGLRDVPPDDLLQPVLSLCDPHAAELVAVVTSRMGLPPLILGKGAGEPAGLD